MTIHRSCGAVLFTRVNGEIKYVLVQQKEGFYGFPKGHMEAGETQQETALREIYEEVGIKPVLLDGFVTEDAHRIPNKQILKQIIYFLAEYHDQEICFDPNELLRAPLVSYEEAMALFTYESSKRILTEANMFLKEKRLNEGK